MNTKYIQARNLWFLALCLTTFATACAAYFVTRSREITIKQITSSDGQITAVWQRKASYSSRNAASDFPAEFQVESLLFLFSDSKIKHPFRPEGKLYDTDWNFNIFSPDGKFIALLQSRFGPYHIIRASNLREYLLGKRVPDFITSWNPPKDGIFVPVHKSQEWRSSEEFCFQACADDCTLNCTKVR